MSRLEPIHILLKPAVPLLGRHMQHYQETGRKMFITALIIIAQSWKEPK
jgi:hypothetical protein